MRFSRAMDSAPLNTTLQRTVKSVTPFAKSAKAALARPATERWR
jgi:hypothetical protein